MNKVGPSGGHRSTGPEVHRKDQENRKLQLELKTEKKKLDSTIIRFQKEMTEMQAVSEPTTKHCIYVIHGGKDVDRYAKKWT